MMTSSYPRNIRVKPTRQTVIHSLGKQSIFSESGPDWDKVMKEGEEDIKKKKSKKKKSKK